MLFICDLLFQASGVVRQNVVECAVITTPVLSSIEETKLTTKVAYRQCGDRYVLIEYGTNNFNLEFTYRIHKITELILAENIPGISEISPGVRSLLIEYNGRKISQNALIELVTQLESKIETTDNWTVPSRLIKLPMAFEDSATLAAVERYRETIRSDAPWLPNNVDFIQKLNGFSDRNIVRNLLYDATFMVLGLGDVFLGAPCAIPLDPRHWLLGSKYNPSRSYTPNGTVGIGGMYMCIYCMDSPGGYQLVGRTVPIWDKLMLGITDRPWLLSVFDQIKYYPVTESELENLVEKTRNGKYKFEIQETLFDYGEYKNWLDENAEDIEKHKKKLKEGNAEAAKLLQVANTWVESTEEETSQDEFGENSIKVYCEFVGRFWKSLVSVGDVVQKSQSLVVIEAMKAELIVTAPKEGKVLKVCGKNGDFIESGDVVVIME